MWIPRVLRRANAFPWRDVAAVAVIGLAFCLFGTGCGDDIGIYRPPKNENPYLPQTSPENVLHNLATSYSMRDYAHFHPLIRDDFIFIFTPESEGGKGVPPDGIWGCADELQATQHMLDPYYVPEESEYKVKSIEMILALSSPLQETDLEGAPRGTLKGRAELGMVVTLAKGGSKLLVRSWPLFYFAPDGTSTSSAWRLWRCIDASFDDTVLRLSTFSRPCGYPDGSDAAIDESVPRIEPIAEASVPEFSWGAVKAIYR